MTSEWLPLTDYSLKYKVSVSTLRRRIKVEDINFRFQEGKYLILDEPMGAHERVHRPSQISDDSSVGTQKEAFKNIESQVSFGLKQDEPILSAANKLLNELKRAYTQVLQEKEEQILQLKGEIADLKTLVRVLEGENQKIQNSRLDSHI